jgi:hypothetical protein
VQRLTGRILPDLFGETRAEEQLRQDLDERAARLRAARGARKTRPSVEPMGANTPLADEPDTAHKAALEPTPAAEPLSLEAPVLTKGLSPNNRIDARRNGVSQQAKASSRAAV